MTWALFVDSSNSVSFHPNWDLAQSAKKMETIHRTQAGRQYRYKWGSYNTFKFSVDFVNSSQAAIVNSWYASNAELLFMDEDTTQVYSVIIQNGDYPFQSKIQPYQEYFKGTIELSTY